MSDENVELARKAYSDFNNGDIPAVLEAYDQELEWIEPGGGGAPSGTFNGPDSVAQEIFGKVPDQFEEFAVEVEDMSDEGDTVVVTGRFKGKSKSGADLDAGFEHVNEFRDGKLVRFEHKSKDPDNWAAAWS